MKGSVKGLLAVAMAFATFNMNAEIINNESIIKMLGKGYDTEIIIGFIDGAEECELKAGMEEVDALIEAGADASLVKYIQKRAKLDNNALDGLYWWNTGAKPQKLNITALSQESKGIGGSLLGGAARIAGTAVGFATGSVGAMTGSWIEGDLLSSSGFKSDKLVIPGESAHLKVNTNPVFRFVIPDAETAQSNVADAWYHIWMASIQSPNEFQLIKLQQKGKGGKAKRTFPSGMKWSAAGFSSSSNVVGDEIVEFEVKQINNRVYEISFPAGLEVGEYAFFYRNANNPLIREHLSAFDFSVQQ